MILLARVAGQFLGHPGNNITYGVQGIVTVLSRNYYLAKARSHTLLTRRAIYNLHRELYLFVRQPAISCKYYPHFKHKYHDLKAAQIW